MWLRIRFTRRLADAMGCTHGFRPDGLAHALCGTQSCIRSNRFVDAAVRSTTYIDPSSIGIGDKR